MKHTMMLMVLAGALALTGCSKKSSNPVQPDTGRQQPAVTFTMHLESGTQGMIFVAVPSEDVTLTKVELSFPGATVQ
jgi:PBP1b-binding outer membrane lipoprotein LpoB